MPGHTTALTQKQLTGRDDSHLVTLASGHRLHRGAAEAYELLKADALEAGFELAIASSYRSFARQCTIWNRKARGERPVHDDLGNPVELSRLAPEQQLQAIMRFSAIPGSSRHHWGTDLDIYDAASVPPEYGVELTPQEVAPGGMFDALHCWLDERMAAGKSRGFYRPYAEDVGGVSPERWHVSYAPVSQGCEAAICPETLSRAWDEVAVDEPILLRDVFEAQLPAIFDRFVRVPTQWCPR